MGMAFKNTDACGETTASHTMGGNVSSAAAVENGLTASQVVKHSDHMTQQHTRPQRCLYTDAHRSTVRSSQEVLTTQMSVCW